MKDCIIADFEWCVTPHPNQSGYFFYFNEILSAGAVRLSESGQITDRFYCLIRPENADFIHPTVLSALHLERKALAFAKDFASFYAAFLAFVGELPVYTWGCADQSALNQNLKIKAAASRTDGGIKMLDLQPLLCRGFGVSMPYPSLSTLLEIAELKADSVRHNALADAEDTARIAAALLSRDPDAAAPLFTPRPRKSEHKARAEARAREISLRTYETPAAALDAVRKQRLFCPSCKRALGLGTWICPDEESRIALCACERCGKFVCEAHAAKGEDGKFAAAAALAPFENEAKERYLAVRRAERQKHAEEKE